ncbi:hypothetical protein E2C01_097486 [Portunus trituberculatus]|uniref:Uncharacterized protein n=1 Tax=Portunus trituberculatus TaxID=210409 RepID=A0A5B7K4Y4_PORTR|nr:hypothetical protein [Portunus trituberculatus]
MKGDLLVEKVFRGVHYGVINMSRVAYKPDYRLIHKHEEARYIDAFRNYKSKDVEIVSPVMDMPPLLKVCVCVCVCVFYRSSLSFSSFFFC